MHFPVWLQEPRELLFSAIRLALLFRQKRTSSTRVCIFSQITLTFIDLMYTIYHIDVFRFEVPRMEYYIENAKVFKALGDPKRAMIVDMLSCGELCACKILEKFEMSQSTLSHHMKSLCGCGLVKGREEGKWTYYSLNAEAVENTKRFLDAITSEKEECVCREAAFECKGCGENG